MENCGGRTTEDGFCHLDGSCHCGKKPSRMEDTSQLPYSLRGELGISSSSSSKKRGVLLDSEGLASSPLNQKNSLETTAPKKSCLRNDFCNRNVTEV